MLFEKKFQQNDKNLYIFDNFGSNMIETIMDGY